MNEVYGALAHPVRRTVLALLRQQDMTAGQLAEHVDVSKPTLSGHLNVLKGADLVRDSRFGSSILYSLNLSVLEEALFSLLGLLQISEQQAAHPHEHREAATHSEES